MLDQVSALGAKGMPSVGVSLVSAMLCAVALLGGCGGAAPATAPAVVDAPPFDRGAAMEALNRAKQEAKTCDEIEPRVNAHVKITFAPDGSVTEAVVDVPELRGAAAACIEPFYRRVRVPAFRGAPVSVGSGIEREAGSDDASELDVAAVRAAIEAVDLSSCSELPGERSGKLYVSLSPRGGHGVSTDDPTASSALGGCLVGKVYRSIQTGPFRGPPVRLERAYVLAPLAQPAPRPIRY